MEALNHALEGIPADRVRLHVCWGNYEGPHTRDIPLAKILPEVLKTKPMAFLIEDAQIASRRCGAGGRHRSENQAACRDSQ